MGPLKTLGLAPRRPAGRHARVFNAQVTGVKTGASPAGPLPTRPLDKDKYGLQFTKPGCTTVVE
jgi:hypothetical protein